MDLIHVKNLEIFAKHGVLPEENVLGQKFIISVALHADLRAAGVADDLSQSVDYGAVCRDIHAFTEGNTFRLIEALAEGLAELILTKYQPVKDVTVEVKKPWAPVTAHLECVSVEITRGRHTAYLSLGSNLGDREARIRFALDELDAARGCRVVKSSELINTAPYGNTEQDEFLNACVELETLLTPDELLVLIGEIEHKAGRERTIHWGPRTLDIDIVLYDNAVIKSESLTVPHPDMHRRDFVLAPLCEIAPDALHPVFCKTARELLTKLRGEGTGR